MLVGVNSAVFYEKSQFFLIFMLSSYSLHCDFNNLGEFSRKFILRIDSE